MRSSTSRPEAESGQLIWIRHDRKIKQTLNKLECAIRTRIVTAVTNRITFVYVVAATAPIAPVFESFLLAVPIVAEIVQESGAFAGARSRGATSLQCARDSQIGPNSSRALRRGRGLPVDFSVAAEFFSSYFVAHCVVVCACVYVLVCGWLCVYRSVYMWFCVSDCVRQNPGGYSSLYNMLGSRRDVVI